MAFTNSLIGYAAGVVTNPAAPGVSDSLIGFAVTTLSGPNAPVGRADSPIGFYVATLTPPHKPIIMRTATGYARTVIKMYNGTNWR